MYKKFLIFLIIIFSFIFSSCSNTLTSEERLSQYLGNVEEIDEIKIVYKATMKEIGSVSFDSLILKFFKKGELEKDVIEIKSSSFSNNASIYKNGNLSISCSKGPFSLFEGSSDEITCSTQEIEIDSFIQIFSLDEILKESNVSSLDELNLNIIYNGERTYLNLTCDEFTIISRDSLFPKDLYLKSKNSHVLEICIDQKTSYILSLKLFSNYYSESLKKSELVELFSFEIQELIQEVADSNFEIPFSYIELGNACSNNELSVVILPLKDIESEVKLNIYEKHNDFSDKEQKIEKTISLSSIDLDYNSKEILNFEHLLNRDFKYELCIGDNCQLNFCYNYDYSDENPIDLACLKLSQDKYSCSSNENCFYFRDLCLEYSCESLDINTCSSSDLGCIWDSDFKYCSDLSCYDFEYEFECLNSDLNCIWDSDFKYCSDLTCYDFYNESSCSSSNLNCSWDTEIRICSPLTCFDFDDESSCSNSNLGCFWESNFQYCNNDHSKVYYWK